MYNIESTNIGRKVTINNNGMCFSLPSMQRELLAPCPANDREYKELTIVSEPYFLHVKWDGEEGKSIYKVFNVLYNGGIYTVQVNSCVDVIRKCPCCGQALPEKDVVKWEALVRELWNGNNKLFVTKELKNATGWGLKESHDFVKSTLGIN